MLAVVLSDGSGRDMRDAAAVVPTIDPMVDLYNAISLRYAVPVGGKNISAYVGLPRLTLTDGLHELFDMMKEDELALL